MRALDEPRYGNGYSSELKRFLTTQTADSEGVTHNLFPYCLVNRHVDLITMCGVRVSPEWEPIETVTDCRRCGLLAAFHGIGERERL